MKKLTQIRTHFKATIRLLQPRLQVLLRLVGISLGLVIVLAVLWKLPEWQVSQYPLVTSSPAAAAGASPAGTSPAMQPQGITLAEAAKLVDEYRKTLVQLLGGAALLLGLYFTWRNIKATERNILLTRDTALEGQRTEQFTRAVELLGAERQVAPDGHQVPKIESRLGGIYALERIARESPKDRRTVMDVLSAYVRENSPWKDEQPDSLAEPDQPVLRTDIQAVLDVLGRWGAFRENEPDVYPNLNGTDLRGAIVSGADFSHAALIGAHLEQAHLLDTDLEDALLLDARLDNVHASDVILDDGHLQGAHLQGALLESAHLRGARLERACLIDACLERADLRGQIWSGLTSGVLAWPEQTSEAPILRQPIFGMRTLMKRTSGEPI
jgi:hypothetical protein